MGLSSTSDIFFLLLRTSLVWMVCFIFVVTLTRRQLQSVLHPVGANSSISRFYINSENVTENTLSAKLANTETCEQPLLTLYTTLKTDPHKNIASTNVILNWAELLPCVQPLLFIQDNTDPSIIRLAQEHSWLIEPVPYVSPIGVPIFKDMYYKARELVNSQFHGYSNGDILYNTNFLTTLKTVAKIQLNGHIDRSYMIVGRRKNYDVTDILYKLEDVHAAVSSPLGFFKSYAVDYFLISGDSYPWHKIPDIVVGRPGYDNFIVVTALSYGVSVIDASNTIGALHQTTEDGNRAGFKSEDSDYNIKLIGEFKFNLGYTSSAQTRTKWDEARENVLIEFNPESPFNGPETSQAMADALPAQSNPDDFAQNPFVNSTELNHVGS